jgi:hypothetical protein
MLAQMLGSRFLELLEAKGVGCASTVRRALCLKCHASQRSLARMWDGQLPLRVKAAVLLSWLLVFSLVMSIRRTADALQEQTAQVTDQYAEIRAWNGQNQSLLGIQVDNFRNPYFDEDASVMPPDQALPIFHNLDSDCPCGGAAQVLTQLLNVASQLYDTPSGASTLPPKPTPGPEPGPAPPEPGPEPAASGSWAPEPQPGPEPEPEPPKPLPTWSRCEFNSTKGQLPPGGPPKSICPGCNALGCTCPKGACWPGKNLTHTPDHTCDCFAKLSFCEKGTQPVYTPGEVCPSCWPPENKACMCFAAIGFCEAVPAPAPAPPHPKSTPPPSPPPSDIWSRGAGDRWSPGVSLVIIGLSCGVILAYIVFRKTRGQCDRPDPIQEHLNDQIQQW